MFLRFKKPGSKRTVAIMVDKITAVEEHPNDSCSHIYTISSMVHEVACSIDDVLDRIEKAHKYKL